MELTKEQKIRVDEYATKCIRDGIATNKFTDKDELRPYINHLYKEYLDLKKPKHIALVDSPEAAIKLAMSDEQNTDAQSISSAILYCNQIRHWVAYYYAGVEILKEELEDKLKDELYKLEHFCTKFHALLPAEHCAILIKYPVKCELKDGDIEKFVLHCNDDFAIKYIDGTGYGYLNGIEVSDYIATTPASELDVFEVLKEQNIDARREGLIKIGAERVAQSLAEKGKVLDARKGSENWDDYNLLELSLGTFENEDGEQEEKTAKCLKMFCPSRGAYVFEFVSGECETVQQALAFRDPDFASVDDDIEPNEVL